MDPTYDVHSGDIEGFKRTEEKTGEMVTFPQ